MRRFFVRTLTETRGGRILRITGLDPRAARGSPGALRRPVGDCRAGGRSPRTLTLHDQGVPKSSSAARHGSSVGAVFSSTPGLACDDDVERAVAGDREALRRLWEVHRRWVAGVILAHMPASAELDDLLQEVAASLVASIGRLESPEHFVGWLRTVAINAARLQGRKVSSGLGRLRLIRGDDGLEAMDGAVTARAGAGRAESLISEEGRRLLALAQSMPEGYREPLLLRCVQGLSYQQIGEILGLPPTTVETRIARGRRMLRERAEAPDPSRTGAGSTG